MKVRKNRSLGVVFAVCGLLILVTGIALARPLLIISGCLIAVFGIPYIVGDMFTLDVAKKTLTLYALLGPAKKEYPFDSISCKEGSVIIKLDGVDKKLPLSKGICEREDWEKFLDEVGKDARNQ